MLQLWFSKIGDTTEIERSTVKLLSDTETKRLSSTRSHHKRREFLLSRALMRHALSQNFLCPIDEWTFTERENLAPRINNLPSNTYLSLSHSKGLICFAISNSTVGIDIEYGENDRDFLALAKIFMNEEELTYLKKNMEMKTDIFYRTWCAKEAYYKAVPSTTQSKISYRDIPGQSLINNETSWSLTEGIIEQFYVTAIMDNKPENIITQYFPEDNNEHHFGIKP